MRKAKRNRYSLIHTYHLSEMFHERGVFLPTRTVYFGSESYDPTEGESGVDYESVRKCIKNLLLLDYMSDDVITLYWNSLGGCWFRGMGLYDTIGQIRSPVRFIGLGMVRSMGTIIMQACSERLLTPNCDFMVHDGTEGMEAETKTFLAWADHAKITLDRMYDIYLERIKRKHPDYTKEKLREKCSHDWIMSAREAVNLGLADKVIRTPQKPSTMEFRNDEWQGLYAPPTET